jgi:hypothetical protein
LLDLSPSCAPEYQAPSHRYSPESLSMKTPRVEGGNPPLAIEWVPQDVDLLVHLMMVYNPKGMAASMMAIPQELLPPISGNA